MEGEGEGGGRGGGQRTPPSRLAVCLLSSFLLQSNQTTEATTRDAPPPPRPSSSSSSTNTKSLHREGGNKGKTMPGEVFVGIPSQREREGEGERWEARLSARAGNRHVTASTETPRAFFREAPASRRKLVGVGEGEREGRGE